MATYLVRAPIDGIASGDRRPGDSFTPAEGDDPQRVAMYVEAGALELVGAPDEKPAKAKK